MAHEREWKEKITGCFDDCGICCYGFCCTPCLFGSNVEKIDGGNCFVWCCAYGILSECYLCWIPHMMKRKVLREKYGLKEEPCGDCPTTLCCSPCALCQEAREMKSKGKEGGVTYNVHNGAPIVHQPGGYSNNIQPDAFYNINNGQPNVHQSGGYSHNIQPNTFYNTNNGPPTSGHHTGSTNYHAQPDAMYNINYGAQMGYNPDPNSYNMYPSLDHNNYGGGPVYQQGSYPYNV